MTAPIAGTFDIALVTDWHVGTGAGRPGELDRLVARDADDLPYIPAKTLIGVWRDGCERIAFGLDDGKYGPWCDWLDEIFGDEPNRARPAWRKPPRSLPRCPCGWRGCTSLCAMACGRYRRAMKKRGPGANGCVRD
jgi:CRISPR-associated protein Csx10